MRVSPEIGEGQHPLRQAPPIRRARASLDPGRQRRQTSSPVAAASIVDAIGGRRNQGQAVQVLEERGETDPRGSRHSERRPARRQAIRQSASTARWGTACKGRQRDRKPPDPEQATARHSVAASEENGGSHYEPQHRRIRPWRGVGQNCAKAPRSESALRCTGRNKSKRYRIATQGCVNQ